MAGVTVAWVHSTDVAKSFFDSIIGLQGHVIVGEQDVRTLQVRYGSGGIADARNHGVAQFLDTESDWLLWVDTDMGFKPDGLDRLLAHANPETCPVVGGLCFALRETGSDGYGGYSTFPIPALYRWAQTPDGHTGFASWHDYPRDTLVRCDATGSAFILIHRSVFETLRTLIGDNWYTPVRNPVSGELLGEDMSFCGQLMEHDIPLHVDTSVKTTHYKPVWVSEEMFDLYVQAATQAGVSSQEASVQPLNRAARRRRRA